MGQNTKFRCVKLSHKLEYACRALAQLGRSYECEKMAHIDALAESEQIPANYLVQILNELRTAGLVVSKRGKQGGYALSRAPERIRLDEIVNAVESDLLEPSCEGQGHSGANVAAVWGQISGDLEKKVSAYTLDSLIVREDGGMYYI